MEIDLNRWELVLTNGQYFVGRVVGADRLDPVQKAEVTLALRKDEHGLVRPDLSIITYPWIVESIRIPEGSLRLAVTALLDHKKWGALIAQSEKLRVEQRAERAGIVLAGH